MSHLENPSEFSKNQFEYKLFDAAYTAHFHAINIQEDPEQLAHTVSVWSRLVTIIGENNPSDRDILVNKALQASPVFQPLFDAAMEIKRTQTPAPIEALKAQVPRPEEPILGPEYYRG